MNGLFCALAALLAFAALFTAFRLPGVLRVMLRGEAPRAAVITDGSQASLERTLRALRRAKSSAELDMMILVADTAMSEENRRISEIASRQDADIVVCAPEEALEAAERHLWRKTKTGQQNTSSSRAG